MRVAMPRLIQTREGPPLGKVAARYRNLNLIPVPQIYRDDPRTASAIFAPSIRARILFSGHGCSSDLGAPAMNQHVKPLTDTSELWREHLLLAVSGAPKPLLANAITALREAPAWNSACSPMISSQWKPSLAVLRRGTSKPWSGFPARGQSHDDLLTAEWLQRAGIAVNTQTTAQAVEAVARDRVLPPRNRISHQPSARRQGEIGNVAFNMPRRRSDRL